MTTEHSERFPWANVNHVAVVVRDAEATARRYWEQLGIGPWTFFTYGSPHMTEGTYLGRPQEYRMRLAFAMTGGLLLEIIQPLLGPSIYEDFLAQRGEGLHHIGLPVKSLDAAAPQLEACGYRAIMGGRGFGKHGDGAFAYYDTEQALGATIELVQYSRERIEPDGFFPPEAANQPDTIR